MINLEIFFFSLIYSKLYIYLGIPTFGKNAVVCGRSKNVGMPIAMLLHADNAGTYNKNTCNLNI